MSVDEGGPEVTGFPNRVASGLIAVRAGFRHFSLAVVS